MDPPPSPTPSLHKVDADGNSAPTDFLCRWKGCGKVLATRKSLNAHEKIHREKADGTKFNCTVPGCGKSFETTRSRRAHELRCKHVLRGSLSYPPLPSSKLLRPFVHTHERNRPMDPPPSPTPSLGHDDEMSDDLGPQDGERDTADNPKTSEAEPEPFSCTIPNYELVLETDDLFSAHVLQCEDLRIAAQQYPCPEPGCDESFSAAHKPLRHRSVHKVDAAKNSSPTDFLCRWKGCGKVLATRKSLNAHEQIHREKADGIKFNCTVPGCGRSFETTTSRRAHELRFKHVLRDSFPYPPLPSPKLRPFVHTHERNRPMDPPPSPTPSLHKVDADGNSAPTDFLCRWKGCGKVLTTRKGLKAHEQIHREKADGIKFNCTVPGCGRSFETTTNRRAHELRFKHVLPSTCP